MKYIIAIPLSLLLLFSGIRVELATHYCCGEVAGRKISFDGEPATCGMETGEKAIYPGMSEFIAHCCYNTTSEYSISSIYVISGFTHHNSVLLISSDLNFQSDINILNPQTVQKQSSGNKPPGISSKEQLSPASLCLFRI
jgi:hypothetical protein